MNKFANGYLNNLGGESVIKDFIEKSKNEKKKALRKKTTKNVAVGAGVGTVIGLAAGVLLAPKSGKELRERLAKDAKEKIVNLTSKKEADGCCCEATSKDNEAKESDN
jgi:hypothetical protein